MEKKQIKYFTKRLEFLADKKFCETCMRNKSGMLENINPFGKEGGILVPVSVSIETYPDIEGLIRIDADGKYSEASKLIASSIYFCGKCDEARYAHDIEESQKARRNCLIEAKNILEKLK